MSSISLLTANRYRLWRGEIGEEWERVVWEKSRWTRSPRDVRDNGVKYRKMLDILIVDDDFSIAMIFQCR